MPNHIILCLYICGTSFNPELCNNSSVCCNPSFFITLWLSRRKYCIQNFLLLMDCQLQKIQTLKMNQILHGNWGNGNSKDWNTCRTLHENHWNSLNFSFNLFYWVQLIRQEMFIVKWITGDISINSCNCLNLKGIFGRPGNVCTKYSSPTNCTLYSNKQRNSCVCRLIYLYLCRKCLEVPWKFDLLYILE